MRNVIAIAVAAAVAGGLSVAAYAVPGAYVGVGGGYNWMDVNNNVSSGANIDTDQYNLNAEVGYLFPVFSQFQLGPELGYNYYGNYQVNATDNSTGGYKETFNAVDLMLVGEYDFTQQWFVQARAGAQYTMMSDSGSNVVIPSVGTLSKQSDDQTLAKAGLSVGYYFVPQFSAALTYDHLFGKDIDVDTSTNDDIPTMDTVGISLTYHFV